MFPAMSAHFTKRLLPSSFSRSPKRKNIPELKTCAVELSKHSGQNSQVLEDDIYGAATEARGSFEGFCACLRFESRISHPKEFALSHLQGTGDFGPKGARHALERLTKAVENESSRPHPIGRD